MKAPEADLNYVTKRNQLIPAASHNAIAALRQKYPRMSPLNRHDVDREFIRQMNILAVQEGLVSEGILVLQDADNGDIPAQWNTTRQIE